jgi:capsid protein
MTFTDAELTRYLDDDPDTAERAAHVSAALLAPLDRLAMVAARHRRPASELDRPLEQLVAALTAVAHRFHAAAQRPDRRLDIAAGVRALHAPDLAHLDPALVEAFEAHCLPHDR